MAPLPTANFTLRTFYWWRTVLFLIPAIGLYTIVLGTMSLVSALLDRKGHFAHWCARTWSRLILLTTGVRVTVDGLERLVPGRTYVFVANHQSLFDIPILFWSLPYQLRIMAKASLGSLPFIGWHLQRTGHLLVDRKRPDRAKIFGWASRLTSRGLCLIVFPEGTRSIDGRVGKFKTGSFLLALEAGLPIVPLSIVGSRHVMLRGRMAAYPGHVRLVVHDPIETPRHPGGDPRELASAARRLAESVCRVVAPAAESDVERLPPDGDALHARA
jgi:1-acyl-sn-glycerol-3-phosphate acyltransferase